MLAVLKKHSECQTTTIRLHRRIAAHCPERVADSTGLESSNNQAVLLPVVLGAKCPREIAWRYVTPFSGLLEIFCRLATKTLLDPAALPHSGEAGPNQMDSRQHHNHDQESKYKPVPFADCQLGTHVATQHVAHRGG